MIDRRTALAGLAGLASPLAAQALDPFPGYPDERIPLWPGRPPGAPADGRALPLIMIEERSRDPAVHDRALTAIGPPEMRVFRPARANGAALLAVPGGGFARLAIDKEGFEIGRWLAARGWTVFVLIHRLPGEGWSDRANVPLADAQRAMRLIRARAGAYGIDPAKLGVMGFSAGGHICSDLATRFAFPAYPPVDAADRLSPRPRIAAPIYGVQSMAGIAHAGSRDLLLGPSPSAEAIATHTPANNVMRDAPPFFLVHAEDDTTVSPENSLELRAACKRAGVSVECHLFAEGGHGFGLSRAAGKPVAIWPELFVAWAARQWLG